MVWASIEPFPPKINCYLNNSTTNKISMKIFWIHVHSCCLKANNSRHSVKWYSSSWHLRLVLLHENSFDFRTRDKKRTWQLIRHTNSVTQKFQKHWLNHSNISVRLSFPNDIHWGKSHPETWALLVLHCDDFWWAWTLGMLVTNSIFIPWWTVFWTALWFVYWKLAFLQK